MFGSFFVSGDLGVLGEFLEEFLNGVLVVADGVGERGGSETVVLLFDSVLEEETDHLVVSEGGCEVECSPLVVVTRVQVRPPIHLFLQNTQVVLRNVVQQSQRKVDFTLR